MCTFAKKPQSTQGRNSGDSIKRKSPFIQSHTVNPILHLQRTVGNQVVQRILRSASQEMSEGGRLIAQAIADTIQQRTGSPVIQLKEAKQAAAVPVVYTQALQRLQSIDATLHQYLQTAGWNTYQQILRVSSGSRNVTFRLRIGQGSLPPGLFARFVRERVDYSDPTNPIYPMTIILSIPSGPTALDELTTALYHEGVHMLIYMDQNLPSPRSPHGAAFDRYLSIARSHQNYVPILDSLCRYMQAFPPSGGVRSLSNLRSLLTSILSTIVEEKYVFDQEQAHFGPGPTNSQIAQGHIVEKLTSMGVHIDRSDQDLADAIQWMTDVFDAIDAQIRSRP